MTTLSRPLTEREQAAVDAYVHTALRALERVRREEPEKLLALGYSREDLGLEPIQEEGGDV